MDFPLASSDQRSYMYGVVDEAQRKSTGHSVNDRFVAIGFWQGDQQMTIRTYSERTPWGVEWYAIDDDIYDGAFDSKMNIAGVGPTEAEALADLVIGLEALAEKTAKHRSAALEMININDLICPECGGGPGEPHSIHCELEHGA